MWKNYILAGCLFLTTAALGQQPKSYICTCRIVDSNAQPVSGAEVLCYEQFYDYGEGRIRWEVLGQEKTSANGRLSLELKVTDKRNVWVVAKKQGLSLGWEQAAYNSADIDFTILLDKPTVLEGTVVDETGQAIANAKLHLCLKSEQGRHGVTFNDPEDWFTATTNPRGRFSFNSIPAGASADFWVEAPGKVCCWTFWDTDLSDVAGSQFAAGRTDVHIVLYPEAKIQGQVIDEDMGNPVEGVQLLARPDKGYAHYFSPPLALSDENGQFSFKGLPDGPFSLQVVPPRDRMADWVGKDVKVMVQTGQAVSDVTVPVGKGAILEVVVRDGETNELIEGSWVFVRQEANFGRHSGYVKSVVTDAGGSASLRVPTGKCSISAGSRKYNYYRSTEPITVGKETVTKHQIQLDRYPSVLGTVRDNNDQPVAAVAVASKPVCEQAVRTTADGRFEVSWRNRDSIRKKFLLAQDAHDNLAGLVEFNEESQPVDIRLKPAFTLRGQVTDQNGKGIAMAAASLWASLPGWSTNIGELVFTDAKGFFRIDSIPLPQPDFSYSIEVNAKGYGPLRLSKISFGDDPAKPVEIDTIVLPLANQSISGVVVDSEDEPAAGVPIFLRGPNGSRTAGQPRRVTVTNAKGRFHIDRICKGPLRLQANFSSRPGGSGFLEAKGGDKNIKIILGQEGVHSPHVSLAGKPLPELKDLKIDLSPIATENKMILVCFFDMEQRPSRNCIMRLAEQAQELKAKDVVVVAVQASKVNEDKLNKWLMENNIPFPVGMVQGDEEKTRFTWGVRSLPWLILTDDNHFVRSEGFGPNELNEKITMLRQK